MSSRTLPAPAIVAESLVTVGDPLRTSLRPGPPASPAHVVGSLAAGVAPACATDEPPGWLRPEQRYPFARALAALRCFRGGLIALPTGSGKTYVALAAAAAWQRSPVACIVPAALARQWRDTAARLGIPVVVSSHERASRGVTPDGTRGLVIVDESHHFRHSGIARYAAVADFLVGRPALLLSATPIVNRVEDLGAQLALAIRDDALTPHGIPSLRSLSGGRLDALAAVIVAPPLRGTAIPPRTRRTMAAATCSTDGMLLDRIDRLTLSRSPGVATLVRAVLMRALASSPAAFGAALRRYRLLLRQCADARADGRDLTRRALRQWAGDGADQLVLWGLVPQPATCGNPAGDLVPEDLPAVDALIATADELCATPDAKLDQLRAALGDGTRTIVFTTARETVTYLRRRLGTRVAWCTGSRAGIDHTVLARDAVLAGFGPGSDSAARVLLTTEVAAEGLDLQGAGRVVHYDLPWTAMRLDQREGRAARLGSAHRRIDVVRFDPPPRLNARLRQLAAIGRTARAPAAAGLGNDEATWRWRDILALRYGDRPRTSEPGTAAVRSACRGMLAGFVIERSADASRERIAGEIVWIAPDGAVTRDAAWLMERLDEAASAAAAPWNDTDAACALDVLSRPIGEALRLGYRARWLGVTADPAAREVARRLRALAGAAARRRDARALALVERALAVAAGGLTAGERRLLDRKSADASTSDSGRSAMRIVDALAALEPAATSTGAVQARLTGMILFLAP